jgi:outer membrane protein, multidrug efflux system
MRNKRILNWAGIAFIGLAYQACNIPTLPQKTENRAVPVSFNGSQDSTNTGKVSWKTFFTDPNLNALIDTAFRNNQELNITLQEIAISQNEIQARKGEYLPFVGLRGGAGVEKAARYTNIGASEATTDIKPGKETPDPLPDVNIQAVARWEVDIWHKLRNAKKAAATRYLSSIEGKNFMMTNLAAEIANSYYELLALDTQTARAGYAAGHYPPEYRHPEQCVENRKNGERSHPRDRARRAPVRSAGAENAKPAVR